MLDTMNGSTYVNSNDAEDEIALGHITRAQQLTVQSFELELLHDLPVVMSETIGPESILYGAQKSRRLIVFLCHRGGPGSGGCLADAACQVIPPVLLLAEIPVGVLPQALPPLLMQRDLNLIVPVISLWATEACRKAFVTQPVASKKAFALAKTIPMLPPKLPCKPCSHVFFPAPLVAVTAALSDESGLVGSPSSSSAVADFGPPAIFRCN
jgi:hypothetical protein